MPKFQPARFVWANSGAISTVLALARKRQKMRGAGAAIVVAAILASVAVAQAMVVLFAVFRDDQGTLQTVSSDPSKLNASNPFFDPSIGTNGQACVTCHEPSTGITISVPFINAAFRATSHGSRQLNPLFRPNDTANNPSTNQFSHSKADYSLILNLGVVRIGKTVPTGTAADFTVVAANQATIDEFASPESNFPLMNDPQHPGVATLSVFRRPLVNTNVNFDSSVLWDGRASISNLGGVAGGQVEGAIQTLLLGADNNLGVNNAIAAFMTGVFTDQKSTNLAGDLDAFGATGGPRNLLALSQSASRPCVLTPTNLTPFAAAVATSTSCTPVKVGGEILGGPPTFTLFNSWANLPNNRYNAGRLSVARGQAVFNKTACVFCHTVPNLGNNASATGTDVGFKSDGTDSPAVLAATLAAATTPAEAKMVQDMIDRVNQLPLYCLRPKTDTSTSRCGSDSTDVVTTDPGRALVTGLIADARGVAMPGAQFKPPILRDLAVRAPFFHNGSAVDMQHLVNFYNLHFNFGLTSDEQADLVNFLNAL